MKLNQERETPKKNYASQVNSYWSPAKSETNNKSHASTKNKFMTQKSQQSILCE